MDSNPTKARAKRSNLLDAIRAIAVTMVVVYHVAGDLPVPEGDAVAAWFERYGMLGVDMFFPLSGYLITGFLLRRHGGADIRVFFLRRIFRIIPLYYLALLLYLLASVLTGINREVVGNLWQNALFLTGWTIFHVGRDTVPYTITWSLSVEEFAYILVGLSALFLRGRLLWALVALCLFSIALRLAINLGGLVDSYFYPPARLDSIAIGGLLAWAHHTARPALVPLLAALAASVAIGAFGSPQLFNTMIFVSISLATCLAIHLSVTWLPQMRDPLTSAVASVGFYSYFIYLFHFFNIAGLDMVLGQFGLHLSFWTFTAMVMLLTYVQAWLSYRFYEGPLMGLGHRLEPQQRGPAEGEVRPAGAEGAVAYVRKTRNVQ